jgi:hypothetical protein
MLNDAQRTAVEKYIEMMSRVMGVEIKYQREKNREFVYFVVDLSKYDINSDNYDEVYYNKIYSKPIGFFKRKEGKILEFIHQMKKVLSIPLDTNIEPYLDFKNYDYLNKVIKDIRNAIKKTDFPNIQVTVDGDFNNPTPILKFGKVSLERDGFKKFLEQLQGLVDYDLDRYLWSYTKSPIEED